MGKEQKTKSPIDEKPLRRAGQSLEEQWEKILEDKIMPYLILFGTLAGIIVWIWIEYLFNINPVIFSLAAIAIMAFCLYKIFSVKHDTGDNFWVQPIVVFPKWFITPCTDHGNKAKHKVWVCNQGYLDGLINKGKTRLTDQQVTVVYNKLAEYIRNY
ncbi:MAG: hypothetical protein L3J71_06605 [Victivallaceae bacterium]|nr:hypothetical protein [Victivallaceae bacterium]